MNRPNASIKTLRTKGVSGSTDYELKQLLDYVNELESTTGSKTSSQGVAAHAPE